MKFRKATEEDIAGIAKVHIESWRTTYKGIVPEQYLLDMSYAQKVKQWKKNLRESTIYIAVDEKEEIQGFICGGAERSGNYPRFRGEIYAFYLLEEVQGQGFGRMLMNRFVTEELNPKGIDSLIIWVLSDNPSRFFYERLGGQLVDLKSITIAGKRLEECAYGWSMVTGF